MVNGIEASALAGCLRHQGFEDVSMSNAATFTARIALSIRRAHFVDMGGDSIASAFPDVKGLAIARVD
jgi:hypothetical protein